MSVSDRLTIGEHYLDVAGIGFGFTIAFLPLALGRLALRLSLRVQLQVGVER